MGYISACAVSTFAMLILLAFKYIWVQNLLSNYFSASSLALRLFSGWTRCTRGILLCWSLLLRSSELSRASGDAPPCLGGPPPPIGLGINIGSTSNPINISAITIPARMSGIFVSCRCFCLIFLLRASLRHAAAVFVSSSSYVRKLLLQRRVLWMLPRILQL